jgi:hypothetical protein
LVIYPPKIFLARYFEVMAQREQIQSQKNSFMKKIIGIMVGIAFTLFSASVYAQDTTKPQTTTPPPPQTSTWDPAKNPTVDALTAPYKGKLIPVRPALTSADIFPVLGKYTSTTNPEAASLTISLDDQNKGLVWIDGLPQGRVKAMLRKSPSTYKIPAQKTADGKDVAEGTLVFDKVAGTLNICIGKPYNAEDPSTAFTVAEEETTTEATTPEVTKIKTKTKVKGQPTVKTKVKVPEQPKPWMYSGTKVDATVMN